MKRCVCILLACMLTIAIVGCRKEIPETEPTAATPPQTTTVPETVETSAMPENTEPVTVPTPETTAPTEETTAPTETTASIPTEPEHSPLYLEGVPVENVILWFNEVVLDTEFYIDGDPSLVQKWEEPILYALHGEATEADLVVLEAFAAWLNTVEGFPGIRQAESGEWVNLRIHFTDEQGLVDVMGTGYTGLDGAVTFWYDGYNRIYDAVICVRTDLDQHLRNSVLLEEIYNGLGPVQDTELRQDSIIYQQYSEVQTLTRVDELILKLLYHPDMRCGMDAAQCEAVIRDLYY